MSGGWGQCQASQRVTGKKRFASGGFGTGWLKDNDGTFTQSRWVFYNDNNNNSNNNNNNGFLYITITPSCSDAHGAPKLLPLVTGPKSFLKPRLPGE